MPPPSRSEIDQLGRRLRHSDPTVEDLKLLERVRRLYDEPLTEVIGVLVGLGLEPGSRSKTTGTIVDKLRRIPQLRLSDMQDLAGARAVVEMTRGDQDALVEQITARFENPRVVDRRARPSHGYRAVHIIAKVGGRPVEIQIRTRMQDLWAQIVERLADGWGRGIRYGEPPLDPDRRIGTITRQMIVRNLMELADDIDVLERITQLRKERGPVVQDLRSSGLPLAAPDDVAAVYAQFEQREREIRAILEALHDATASRTLGR
jgi:hypothetical protein